MMLVVGSLGPSFAELKKLISEIYKCPCVRPPSQRELKQRTIKSQNLINITYLNNHVINAKGAPLFLFPAWKHLCFREKFIRIRGRNSVNYLS